MEESGDKGTTIQIVNLDDESEDIFWNHVEKDPLEYFFFIMDWKYQKEDTKILMAMEGDLVRGMMVIFKDSVVQVRGDRGAVEALLDQLHLSEIEMMAPMESEDLVLQRFDPGIKKEMLIMRVDRGSENILKEHEPFELRMKDAEQVAMIMRESLPDWWGQTTAESIRNRMKKKLWMGCKAGDDVVSLGNAFLEETASIVGVVATHEKHRNKGYATSVISGLLERIFKKHDRVIIHVLKDNFPAIRTYEKVGFKPHKTYLLVKNTTRIE